ncbi:MAG TPA: zf-TFIIB domain-containing protein [Candidatus Saccharimonadales bacterium]|nr:zf-TFIIB domain-containing protein [Candidatus Saccharimonadales bacterium]
MKCPVDGATLAISERSGIEIDYCPECRGVWLDRGELDKLIKGVNEYDERRGNDRDRYDEDDDDDNYRRRDDHSREGDSHHGKKKRGGFMENIFDGFGD